MLANGEILDMMGRVRKDSTGPDLRQLFISSEGTLGIVTAVGLQCYKKDSCKKVVFLDFDSYDDVLYCHDVAKEIFGRNLSAIEYMDYESYWSVEKAKKKLIDFPYKVQDVKGKFFV